MGEVRKTIAKDKLILKRCEELIKAVSIPVRDAMFTEENMENFKEYMRITYGEFPPKESL